MHMSLSLDRGPRILQDRRKLVLWSFLDVFMFRSNAISIATALLGTATAVLAQDNGTAELDLVRAVLAQLQPISIAENVEYCGYIGFDDEGTLTATKATQGDTGSCLADEPDDLAVIVASYHTHGGYSSDYFNEVPSADDIEGDEAEGIDGYVATPGGRL